MTRTILTFSILTILTSSCLKNVLTYKHRKFYNEKSIIKNDTPFTLNQNVCYNRPDIIDEEFCYDLTLIFLDTALAKTKKILNLATDTLILKSQYGRFSVWDWEEENNKVSGQIEIISWDKTTVTLKEKIFISEFGRKKSKIFKGTRTYKRKDG